ncbi:MAG: hypothetical protein ABW007_22090 [Chitinophagaceae bacterium]
MEIENWISKITLSSIPLRQLNEVGIPINFASGCLIDYCGKRIILTVAHATGNDQNWGIEIQSKENVATKIYQIGAMMFLTVGNLHNDTIKEVDFSYATVPNDLQPYYHEMEEKGQIIIQKPREILHVNFDLEPSAEKKYGFFGHSAFSFNDGHVYSQSRLVPDLQFVGFQDDFYKFKLPFQHPGDEYFRGTSGAPILDTDGNVVALVSHGEVEEDIICGIALKKYKSALDIETGNFNK